MYIALAGDMVTYIVIHYGVMTFEKISALLVLREGNSTMICGFPCKKPVMRNNFHMIKRYWGGFDVFVVVSLSILLYLTSLWCLLYVGCTYRDGADGLSTCIPHSFKGVLFSVMGFLRCSKSDKTHRRGLMQHRRGYRNWHRQYISKHNKAGEIINWVFKQMTRILKTIRLVVIAHSHGNPWSDTAEAVTNYVKGITILVWQ